MRPVPDRLQRIVELIDQQPGIKAGKVAKAIGVSSGAIYNYLSLLERHAFLVSEDAAGQLYYHGRAEVPGLRRLP